MVSIKGAGLVHTPNLHLTSLDARETEMDLTAFLAGIAKMLDLDDDASPEDVTKALEAVIANGPAGAPDPARYVPIEAQHDAMRAKHEGTALMSQQQVAAKVETAFAKGYITAGMRPWATALRSTDEAAFDTFVATSVPAFAHLQQPSRLSGKPLGTTTSPLSQDDPDMLSICAQLGLRPDQLRS